MNVQEAVSSDFSNMEVTRDFGGASSRRVVETEGRL